MAARGTLAITARGDGNRWYGRLSIAVSAAREACLKEGVRVSARCVEGNIVIQADDQGRIRFPPPRGKSDPRHAFEAATTTLGLKQVKLCQSATVVEVSEGQIRMRVPEECVAAEDSRTKRPRKEIPRKAVKVPDPLPDGASKAYGAAAAIITEAGRAGKTVRPMKLQDIVLKLIELGQQVHIQGPRFFKLNGKSATPSDLLDEINRLSGSSEQDRIALVLD